LTPIDTLFTNAKFADGSFHDIAVSNGRIAAVSPAGTQLTVGATTQDIGGALLVPGFVEGHIHLDTSFYGDGWKPHKPCTNGFNVHERVAFQAQNIAEAAPLEIRARNQLELCIGQGSTQMRSHVMVDGSVGLPCDDVDPETLELAPDDRGVAVVLDGDERLASAQRK